VVSRSTNDVEAIQDMLETGFDSLITAALTLIGTAILLVTLDVRLGLMCLAGFPVLVGLVWWFRNESAKTYRKVRESAALVIVQFVETMTGIKAVQAYRREPRNQEIFEDVADRYKADNEKTFRLLAIFMPGVKLVGNVTTGVVLLYGGYRVLHGQMTIGNPGGVPAVSADVLRTDAGDLAVLQHIPVRVLGTGEAGRCAGRAAGHQDPERPVSLEAGARRRRVPRCPVLVCAGAAGAARPDRLGSGGADRRARSHTGAGKTTIAKLIRPVLRPCGGLGDAGWR